MTRFGGATVHSDFLTEAHLKNMFARKMFFNKHFQSSFREESASETSKEERSGVRYRMDRDWQFALDHFGPE